jgi:hypothetical protein
VLLSTLPLSDVLATISPGECALAFTFVDCEFSFIAFAILPGKYAIPMHLVAFPLALVEFTIRPVVLPSSTYLVLLEFAIIEASICEGKFASAVLFAISVLTFVLGTVWP